MPRYVSHEGVWHPAKEHAVLPQHSGTDKEVYDGPDRAALLELWREKVETFGVNFRKSPEFLQMLRELNFKNEKEYFKFVGYDPEAAKEHFEKNAHKVSKHEMPKRVEAIQALGGGRDTSGTGKDMYGGFGEEPAIT